MIFSLFCNCSLGPFTITILDWTALSTPKHLPPLVVKRGYMAIRRGPSEIIDLTGDRLVRSGVRQCGNPAARTCTSSLCEIRLSSSDLPVRTYPPSSRWGLKRVRAALQELDADKFAPFQISISWGLFTSGTAVSEFLPSKLIDHLLFGMLYHNFPSDPVTLEPSSRSEVLSAISTPWRIIGRVFLAL